MPVSTVKIAKALGIKTAIVRNWCVQGLLKAYRNPTAGGSGPYFIYQKDFEEFVKSNKLPNDYISKAKKVF